MAERTESNPDVHLRVLGIILEEHQLYRTPHLEASKRIVIDVLRAVAPATASAREIQAILCFREIPLISRSVLREAVSSLANETKIEFDKKTKGYRLVGNQPARSGRLEADLSECWHRHFWGCAGASLDHFRQAVCLMFSRYGCTAYESLTGRAGAPIRVSEIVGTLNLTHEAATDFTDCFSAFVLSSDPADATLKVRLASTYVWLRMNGAANAEPNELSAFFSTKRLLLDTNVLFEILGNISQASRFFSQVVARGARLIVGSETRKEFERALRNQVDQISSLLRNGVDVNRLIDERVIRGPWIRALLDGCPTPTPEHIFARVDDLIGQVDGILASSDVSIVNLERSIPDARRTERIAEIKALALKTRTFEKGDEVASHDALLWEAVEDDPKIADLVLTLDRSLERIKVGGNRLAVPWDEIVAYTLMGGVGEQDFAELLNYSLARDLSPDAAFLSVHDVQTIAQMESALLAGPGRALREAARKLAALRNVRLASGQQIPHDEVGRILLASISAYKDDRAAADREREQRVAAETRLAQIEGSLEVLSDELREARAASKRLDSLETSLNASLTDLARLRADAAESTRRQATAEADEKELIERTRRRRDWMLFSAVLIGAVIATSLCGLRFAALLLAIAAAGGLLWSAVAQQTPKPSFKVIGSVIGILAAIAGILEKWPSLRAFGTNGVTEVRSTLPTDAHKPAQTGESK